MLKGAGGLSWPTHLYLTGKRHTTLRLLSHKERRGVKHAHPQKRFKKLPETLARLIGEGLSLFESVYKVSDMRVSSNAQSPTQS